MIGITTVLLLCIISWSDLPSAQSRDVILATKHSCSSGTLSFKTVTNNVADREPCSKVKLYVPSEKSNAVAGTMQFWSTVVLKSMPTRKIR